MGKQLIIKGADFMENRISGRVSYLYGITDEQFNAQIEKTSFNNSYHAYAFGEQLGKIDGSSVYGLKFKTAQIGIIPVFIGTFASETSAGTNLSQIGTIEIDEVDKITTYLFDEPVIVNANQRIIIGHPTTKGIATGKFYYGAGTYNLAMTQNSNTSWVVSSAPLGVDYIVG